MKLTITMVSGGFEGDLKGDELAGDEDAGAAVAAARLQAEAVAVNHRHIPRGVANDAPGE